MEGPVDKTELILTPNPEFKEDPRIPAPIKPIRLAVFMSPGSLRGPSVEDVRGK